MIRRLAQHKRRTEFAGHCDGLDGRELYGWAWRPDAPDVRLEVEQWVDGVLTGRTLAELERPDLESAGVGDGNYGWRMPLILDPGKAGLQAIEVRVPEWGVLPNGRLELAYEPPPEEIEDASAPQEELPAPPLEGWGQCDGRDGALVFGWAWRPDVPEQHVVVEQWVDGTLVDERVADRPRADLFDAEVGHGAYGWSMPLKLDPAKTGPQAVELRIRGAGTLANSRFELSVDEVATEAELPAEVEAVAGVVGHCDGLKGPALYGWAWDPSRPDEAVEVELWVNATCVATCVADVFRPDLRSNGVGTGRYGWRLPVQLPPAGAPALAVEVRARHGAPLDGGVLELKNDLTLDDPGNAALRPFVEAVLNATAQAPASTKPAFLLYCPSPGARGKFWARDYDDYPAVMRAFEPVLARLGEVVVVGSLDAAHAACAEQRGQGRHCVMLAFGPPRRTPLDAPCPVVPAFAWAFPTIPTGAWDGDQRSDWRRVLRFTGRALVFSRFAAEAVQAAMGADFPVVAIPPPARATSTPKIPEGRRTLSLKGMVFDSRRYEFQPDKTTLPTPVWDGGGDLEAGEDIEVEGVLFTAVLDLNDGRKNWADLVTAFIRANQDKADAVLLLKLSEPDATWMQSLYRCLSAQPRFACRVLAVRGPLAEPDYEALIAASHWYVSAAKAEGSRLPMLDFLAAGRPAISPVHTAVADDLDAENALVVASEEEPWNWPQLPPDSGWSWSQHPDDVGLTTVHRVSWASLVEAFREGYRLATAAPKAYASLSSAARRRAAASSDAVPVAAAVEQLLAREAVSATCPGPSRLLRESTGG